ncbi:MAG: hypothetical protein JNK22_09925 [Rhodocyclaceae bacterium]|nr:hypothetical protein [Rhodocyclaceae bacterium]
MDKYETGKAKVSREGRWLIIIAVVLVASSLGGTVWVFLNKDSFAKTQGRQLPPSAKPAVPAPMPAPPTGGK